jgi:hypothetical protein
MKRSSLMEFERLPVFKKELKNLLKKYRTLEQDLEVVQFGFGRRTGRKSTF